MELAVLNKSGKETGRKISLDAGVFGVEPNDHAIYLDVKEHLANKRQGTHKSKEKWEISGSTRKLKKQKGTGTARAGSIKSPLLRGGARVFGPQPRDYGFKVNKKVSSLARKSALSYKASQSSITILENVELSKPSTKEFISLLKGLSLDGQKALFVLDESNKNFYLSGRNLSKVEVITADQLSTYSVLNASKLILSEGSVTKIQELLNK